MRLYGSNLNEDLDLDPKRNSLLDSGPSLASVADTIKRQASHNNDLQVYPYQSVEYDHTVKFGLQSSDTALKLKPVPLLFTNHSCAYSSWQP